LLLAACDIRRGFGAHGSPVSEPEHQFFPACPMANASYTNLLLDPGSLVRVMRNLVSVPE
jgi:hypothetical protein